MGPTLPDAGVIATSPATAPVTIPRTLGLPCFIHSTSIQDTAAVAARKVLAGVLQHVGAELAARQMIAAEQDTWGSVAHFAAEYETIAAAAQ